MKYIHRFKLNLINQAAQDLKLSISVESENAEVGDFEWRAAFQQALKAQQAHEAYHIDFIMYKYTDVYKMI